MSSVTVTVLVQVLLLPLASVTVRVTVALGTSSQVKVVWLATIACDAAVVAAAAVEVFAVDGGLAVGVKGHAQVGANCSRGDRVKHGDVGEAGVDVAIDVDHDQRVLGRADSLRRTSEQCTRIIVSIAQLSKEPAPTS